MIIVDASPLIVLTKTKRLTLLREVYGEVCIGPWVRSEVVDRGRTVDPSCVIQIEAALAERWIREVRPSARVKSLTRQLMTGTRLGAGEAESLALARLRRLMIVLDDKEARVMAATMGVPHVGTAGVLLAAFLRGYLSYEPLEESVRDLSRVLWLSPEVVAEILRRGRDLQR